MLGVNLGGMPCACAMHKGVHVHPSCPGFLLQKGKVPRRPRSHTLLRAYAGHSRPRQSILLRELSGDRDNRCPVGVRILFCFATQVEQCSPVLARSPLATFFARITDLISQGSGQYHRVWYRQSPGIHGFICTCCCPHPLQTRPSSCRATGPAIPTS